MQFDKIVGGNVIHIAVIGPYCCGMVFGVFFQPCVLSAEGRMGTRSVDQELAVNVNVLELTM